MLSLASKRRENIKFTKNRRSNDNRYTSYINNNYCHNSTLLFNKDISLCINENNKIIFFSKHLQREDNISNSNNDNNSKLYILPLSDIKSISIMNDVCIALDMSGNIYRTYNNKINNNRDARIMRIIHIPIEGIKINQISCSNKTCILLSTLGEVYSFGSNSYGLLGLELDSPLIILNIPAKLRGFNDKVKIIECACYSAMCVLINNECYGWGHNYMDKLNLINSRSNVNDIYNVPMQCITNIPDNIISIKLNVFNSFFLTEQGKVFRNNYIKSNDNISYGTTKILNSNEKITPPINNIKQIKDIPIINKIICGLMNFSLLDINGEVWFGFISNTYSMMPNGDNSIFFDNEHRITKNKEISNIVDISTSYDFKNIIVGKTLENKIILFDEEGLNINHSFYAPNPIDILIGNDLFSWKINT